MAEQHLLAQALGAVAGDHRLDGKDAIRNAPAAYAAIFVVAAAAAAVAFAITAICCVTIGGISTVCGAPTLGATVVIIASGRRIGSGLALRILRFISQRRVALAGENLPRQRREPDQSTLVVEE